MNLVKAVSITCFTQGSLTALDICCEVSVWALQTLLLHTKFLITNCFAHNGRADAGMALENLCNILGMSNASKTDVKCMTFVT